MIFISHTHTRTQYCVVLGLVLLAEIALVVFVFVQQDEVS